MILKQTDDKQDDIDILHNLASRATSSRQRSDIQSEIDNIVAGVRGETDASYYLDQEFRHRDDIVVIHDLRIEEEGDIAQIDHIVINPKRQAIVLETKALKAEISCNDEGEWEAKYGRQKFSIASPVEQSKRHAAVLRRWLARRKTALREVIPVVLVSPTTRLGQRAAGPDDPEVVKSDLFSRWFDKTSNASSNFIGMDDDQMSEDELAGIGYRLVRAHTPIQFDWRKRFGFPSTSESEDKVTADHPKESDQASAQPPAAKDDDKPDRRKHIGKTEVPISGGIITVFRYANGDRGIRCDDDSLREKVSEVCRQQNGRWVPFPKFWLVSLSACKSIITDLGGQILTSPAETSPSSNGEQPSNVSQDESKPTIPDKIETPHGNITIRAIPSGYAVRNPYNPEIITIVKTSCRTRGVWNPRYKNWIIPEDHIAVVIDDLQSKVREL